MTEPMTDLTRLGVRALLAGYAGGRFTPRDVMDAIAARVALWEPELHALYAYDPDAARQAADASTARWRAGRPEGALDGVPVTVKDLIATRGTPTPLGTAATILVPAAADAPPAARLREAGAIIFAKTTMPDYGMLSSGLSTFHPLTRNPWDVRANPGGSSSGAAAAGAAGYGPLHVGTDIGGSIRLPAAWCGLVGLKPSLGRVPIDPYYVGRCAGPMTRTVDDAAFMMAVLAQPDPRDATSLPPARIDWHSAPAGVAGLRVGLMLDGGCGMACDEEIARAVRAAAAVFAQAGAAVTEIGPVLTRAILDGVDLYWRARFWGEIARLPAARRELVLPFIRAWVERGGSCTGPEAVAGFDRIYELKRRCASVFDRVDLLLSPVTPNISFPAQYASPLNDPDRPFEHIAYTVPWNMGEQPAIALPCGVSAGGMPIGLQIVAPRFCDLEVIQLARWYEARRDAMPDWPEPPRT
jgi:aspartyl-tRNA(Asn)/glutamyl-tRNA(Gln) amidotransferase subunit A